MEPDDKKEKPERGSPLDFIGSETSINSAVVIAIAFGIFTVLLLYEQVEKFSLGWFVLSAVYWFSFAFGIRSILLWALNGLIQNYYRSRIVPELDDDLKNIIHNNFFLRNFYNSMWKDNNLSKSNVVIWIGLVGCIALGALLWYVIAVDQVCIQDLTRYHNGTKIPKC